MKKIDKLTSDEFYSEPDEFGIKSSPIIKLLYYYIEFEFDKNYEKIKWNRGDIKGLYGELKEFLSDRDIIAMDDKEIIDIKNSNTPKVAKLVIELGKLV